MPESLHEEFRRPFSISTLVDAVGQVLGSRMAVGYTFATGFIFAAFVGYLSSCQQVFVELYAVGEWFPVYFGGLALSLSDVTVDGCDFWGNSAEAGGGRGAAIGSRNVAHG